MARPGIKHDCRLSIQRGRVVQNRASKRYLLTHSSKTGKRVEITTYQSDAFVNAELRVGTVTETSMAEFLAEERAQDERMLQNALGRAVQESFQTIIHEPLPNRIGLLLLQLALGKVIDPEIEEAPQGDVSGLMDEPQKLLVKATRHVVQAERIVARQRERIVRLRAQDFPIEDALQLLDTFIRTLSTMKDHQRLLREEAEGKDVSAGWLFSRVAARTPQNVAI